MKSISSDIINYDHNDLIQHHKTRRQASRSRAVGCQCPPCNSLRWQLTSATITKRPTVFLFLHHIWRRMLRAPLLNAVACPAITSVLSTSNSIRSPLLRICSTFWTIMSLAWVNSDCARASSSVGGDVLYVCIKDEITGPKESCRP